MPDFQPPLIEGLDYYIENGKWVFTAEFLKRRGTCCSQGCRHCPFRVEEAKPGRDFQRGEFRNTTQS